VCLVLVVAFGAAYDRPVLVWVSDMTSYDIFMRLSDAGPASLDSDDNQLRRGEAAGGRAVFQGMRHVPGFLIDGLGRSLNCWRLSRANR
jgi:hypothetical protein